jgi:hypothetical protein
MKLEILNFSANDCLIMKLFIYFLILYLIVLYKFLIRQNIKLIFSIAFLNKKMKNQILIILALYIFMDQLKFLNIYKLMNLIFNVG